MFKSVYLDSTALCHFCGVEPNNHSNTNQYQGNLLYFGCERPYQHYLIILKKCVKIERSEKILNNKFKYFKIK